MEAATEPERVQILAEAGIRSLPSRYVQPPDLRPGTCRRRTVEGGIPVIDLGPSGGDPIPLIGRACREWGAFQVVNHGVPPQLLEEVKAAGSAFFRSPMGEKLRFACDPQSPATEGYGSRMLSKEDGILDWRDYFDHHTLPESRRNPSRWPDFPANYRNLIAEYSNNMKNLAQVLLRMMSKNLGLQPSYMEEAVGEVYQNITISYYPPCPQPELVLGLQSHSDIGVITLIIQDDVGGLEVLKDGEWVEVQPLSDTIIVLLSDQTEVISNGEYKSVVHRAVVNNHQPRLSVSTFYDPSKTRKIYPAPQLATANTPLKYREVLYGDYLSSWYNKGPDGKRNIDFLLVHQ